MNGLMVDTSQAAHKPIVVDLFCGAGGMSLGFQMAGYHIGLGIEKEILPWQTHYYNFDESCYHGDISEIVDPEALLEQNGISRVDVIIGGPPCQGYSRVGRGKLAQVGQDRDHYLRDPRNKLWQEFLRFVRVLKPQWFVMENVPDMAGFNDGSGLLIDKILQEFERLGYTCDQRILLAADYGVPQTRNRLFIVGNKCGHPIPWPEATHGTGAHHYVTVWEAISDLPIVKIKHRKDEIPYKPRGTLTEYQLLMREGAGDVLYNHQTRWHNQQDIRAFRWLPEGGKYVDLPDRYKRYRDDIFLDKYWKLRRDAPCWTIEAHIGKDSYRYIYPSRTGEPEPARTISVREAARLQGFPDKFRFYGPFTKQFHQVGNAVPPLLSKAVASAILPCISAPAPLLATAEASFAN
jgi:DNA (cytosine-5)-methyltransferase 1